MIKKKSETVQMNSALRLYDETMGKYGHLHTLTNDCDIHNTIDMDLENEQDYLPSKYYDLINTLDNLENADNEHSGDEGENVKEDDVKQEWSDIDEVDDCDCNLQTSETEKRLTVDNVNALTDLVEAIEFSIEHDINIDNLDTIEECKERFLLHIEKEKNGTTKKHQVNLFKNIYLHFRYLHSMAADFFFCQQGANVHKTFYVMPLAK